MSVFNRFGASRLVLAVALASGVAVTFAAPAEAAKKKEEKAEANKGTYSKEFAAAYSPFATKLKEGGDLAALKPELAALQATAQTPDDKYTAGQVTVSLGVKLNDRALQRQGGAMMVDSGSTLAGAERASQIYSVATMAYEDKDWAVARTRAQEAVAAGYNGDVDLLIAETYFAENQPAAGIDALDKAIAKKVAAGQPVPDSWLKRGLALAYNNKLGPAANKYAAMYAQYYPSASSWGDAIGTVRTFNQYRDQDLLDVMRLAQRAGALRSADDYLDYVSAADARRLPGETQRIIKAGIAAGLLNTGDPFINDANTISSGRVAADMADLPKIATEARAAGATATTLMAAGDAFLSYQKPAEAEEFYTLALAKPGADTARVLTRLGIAQLDQGKTAEAEANFAKVEGARQAMARLWALYAQQSGKPAAQ